MRAYRVTLVVLDHDHVPDPVDWDWDVFDVAPAVRAESSEEITLEAAGMAEIARRIEALVPHLRLVSSRSLQEPDGA